MHAVGMDQIGEAGSSASAESVGRRVVVLDVPNIACKHGSRADISARLYSVLFPNVQPRQHMTAEWKRLSLAARLLAELQNCVPTHDVNARFVHILQKGGPHGE